MVESLRSENPTLIWERRLEPNLSRIPKNECPGVRTNLSKCVLKRDIDGSDLIDSSKLFQFLIQKGKKLFSYLSVLQTIF